jgi:adenine deaminase
VIGGIAPGRLADFNILDSLHEPRPLEVWAEGEKIAENGHLLKSLHQESFFADMRKWHAEPVTSSEIKQAIGQVGQFPVIEMINSVITKLTKETINLNQDVLQQVEDQLPIPDNDMMVLLVDKNRKWITPAIVRGIATEIDGIASSYNGSNHLFVMGRSLKAMEKAIQQVIDEQGGICWIQEGRIFFSLPLPILGKMSHLPIDAIIEKLKPFDEKIRSYGYTFEDPIYTFLFLSSTHLPQVRLTADGLMRIKDKVIIYPSVSMI